MQEGERLRDRYALSRYPLAHNGMGEVWTAQDELLARPVIVKLLDAAWLSADMVRRFRREALLTARLDHPGVPAIYDLGEHRGRPYVVLQHIDGISLDDLLAEQGPLPVAWVAAIGAQVSAVLSAAGRIELVHRDIKPGNIMLDRSGAVKVLDFGLAVVRDDDRYSRITETGQVLGTRAYMAPEQLRGEPADHRTDLYGLGATLFDLLTGDPPFEDVTQATARRPQGSAPVPRFTESRPDVPAAVEKVVHALLAHDARDRPAGAAEVYAALAPFAADPPPLPGVVADDVDAVRAYAAIVGRVPGPAVPAAAAQPDPSLDVAAAAAEAQRRHAAGDYRAAARQWRRLAEQLARQRGDNDPLVFDYRVRAARAHVPLGEIDRAVNQLRKLREERLRRDGPEHPAVLELQRQIAEIDATLRRGGKPDLPGSTPGGSR